MDVNFEHELLCSKCSAGKFMIWGSDTGTFDLPKSLSKTKSGHYFSIRCDFFKLTVFSPETLIKCDAFREVENGRGEKNTV
jgi:hypothetical protein